MGVCGCQLQWGVSKYLLSSDLKAILQDYSSRRNFFLLDLLTVSEGHGQENWDCRGL